MSRRPVDPAIETTPIWTSAVRTPDWSVALKSKKPGGLYANRDAPYLLCSAGVDCLGGTACRFQRNVDTESEQEPQSRHDVLDGIRIDHYSVGRYADHQGQDD